MCNPTRKHSSLQTIGVLAAVLLFPTTAFCAEAQAIGGGVANQLNTSTDTDTTIGNTESITYVNGDATYINGVSDGRNRHISSSEKLNTILKQYRKQILRLLHD